MKYAVQYAYNAGVHTPQLSMSNTKIVEDTNPIDYEEALKIFNSHLDDFIYRLNQNERPELCIWKDVGDGEYPVYGEILIHLDWTDDLEYIGGKFYKTVKSEIKLPE
jgi:hypothetical protein